MNWKVRDKGKEEFSSAKTVSVSASIGRSLTESSQSGGARYQTWLPLAEAQNLWES